MSDLSALKTACVEAFLQQGQNGGAMASFRTAADPETVLELVERLEAAEKRLAEVDAADPDMRAERSKLAALCNRSTALINLPAYFASFARWHWPEVAEEGRRLLEELLGRAVEEGSALDSVISGIAAQSSQGAYSAAAAMLGTDGRALQAIALGWEESQDSPAAAISFDELRTKILLYKNLVAAQRADW